jgi:hypothetical protein
MMSLQTLTLHCIVSFQLEAVSLTSFGALSMLSSKLTRGPGFLFYLTGLSREYLGGICRSFKMELLVY